MTLETVTHSAPTADFMRDVIEGLSHSQKSLPCRWFYDARGSELFEQITELPEYYLTRTETEILNKYADDIAMHLPSGGQMVEWGAGAATKTRILLRAAPQLATYIPIDISRSFLFETADKLREEFPSLSVVPIVGDFLSMGVLNLSQRGSHSTGFFPGSTIGNLDNATIISFLSTARQSLGAKAEFILGVDMVKDTDVLVSAYDDSEGITAAFNKNLLVRINRELGGHFDLDNFSHEACWNDKALRIEMYLVSKTHQSIKIGDQSFEFAAGERLHTENSRKFTLGQIRALAAKAGWRLAEEWSDARRYVSVVRLEAAD